MEPLTTFALGYAAYAWYKRNKVDQSGPPSDSYPNGFVAPPLDYDFGSDSSSIWDQWTPYIDRPDSFVEPYSDPYADTGPSSDFETFIYTVSDTPSLSWSIPPQGKQYETAILAAEARYSLPRLLLARLLMKESSFNPKIINGQITSPAGAVGIAQFMPATAADLKVNPLDPFASIDAAARYLSQLYTRFQSWPYALAAYNWGQGNVARYGINNAPAETRDYLSAILSDIPVT